MKTTLKLATSLFVVLATLVVSSAFATEHKAKPGDEVTVDDGDTITVELPKSKTTVKVTGEPTKPVVQIEDEWSKPEPVSEPEDVTSTVEVAVRGLLTPSGPQLGGTLGFSYKLNRARLYLGANIGKGLTDFEGTDQKLVVFGFTAGASKLLTRTIEIGLFGTADWAYRGLTKDTATSFIGGGPAFRLNKYGLFFQAGLMFGGHKKFNGDWEQGSTLETALGFRF